MFNFFNRGQFLETCTRLLGTKLFDCFFWWRSWAPENVLGAQLSSPEKAVKNLGARHNSWVQVSRNWPQKKQGTRVGKTKMKSIHGVSFLKEFNWVQIIEIALSKVGCFAICGSTNWFTQLFVHKKVGPMAQCSTPRIKKPTPYPVSAIDILFQ